MKTAELMRKPLGEWTLREAMDFCYDAEKKECKPRGCVLFPICHRDVYDWCIDPDSSFSASEVHQARMLNKVLKYGLHSIVKEKKRVTLFYNLGENNIEIDGDAFPSAEIGKEYMYEDIVGDDRF